MKKENLIHQTLQVLTQLPQHKVHEVVDFAEYLLKKHDEEILQKSLYSLASENQSFDFLKEEEIIYSINDLKKRY